MEDFTEKEMEEFSSIMRKHGVITHTWGQMQCIAKAMKEYALQNEAK